MGEGRVWKTSCSFPARGDLLRAPSGDVSVRPLIRDARDVLTRSALRVLDARLFDRCLPSSWPLPCASRCSV